MSHCSLKIALAQLQKPLTDAAASVELEGMEEVENSFSLDLSFSTGNVRMRHLREMRNAAAKFSKVKLQLVPQPLNSAHDLPLLPGVLVSSWHAEL